MSTAELTVAAVQRCPEPRDIQTNVATVASVLAGDTGAEADLIVFPELFLSGYQTSHLEELCLTTESAEVQQLSAACAASRTAVLVGYMEAEGDAIFDSTLAIDRDGAVHPPIRKSHLFGDESTVFARGDSIEPVSLCGVSVGVINCFEFEFPEIARTLALKGAQLLAGGSANMHPYGEEHEIATRARALENRLPLVYANRIGAESGFDFCGSSRVVNMYGQVVSQLSSDEAGTILTKITVGQTAAAELDALAHRRPELYSS